MCAEGMHPCEQINIVLDDGEFWHHYWIGTDSHLLRIQSSEVDDCIKIAYNPEIYGNINAASFSKYFSMNQMAVRNMNLQRLSSFKDKLYINSLEVPTGVLKLHDCKQNFLPLYKLTRSQYTQFVI